MALEPDRPDAAAAAEHELADERGWFSPGVASVAGASALSDMGHEIGSSLLPTLLTSSLHAGPAALGVIEGASDALIGLSKLAGGPLADDPARRRRQAVGGYLVTRGRLGCPRGGRRGLGIGLAETAESTMVAQVAPAHLRGSAFGLLGLAQAAGDLGSTAVVGVLWAVVSPLLGFGYAAAWMVVTVVSTTALGSRHRGRSDR